MTGRYRSKFGFSRSDAFQVCFRNRSASSRSRRLIFISVISRISGLPVAEDEDPAQCGVEVLRNVSVNQGRVLPAPITRFPELMIPHREPA